MIGCGAKGGRSLLQAALDGARLPAGLATVTELAAITVPLLAAEILLAARVVPLGRRLAPAGARVAVDGSSLPQSCRSFAVRFAPGQNARATWCAGLQSECATM